LGLKIDAFAAERQATIAALEVLEVSGGDSSLFCLRSRLLLPKNQHRPSDEIRLRLRHVELECDRYGYKNQLRFEFLAYEVFSKD
jgi:hypothetical protein